jgi:hypothetical protein
VVRYISVVMTDKTVSSFGLKQQEDYGSLNPISTIYHSIQSYCHRNQSTQR